MNRTQIEWCRNPDGSPGYSWNPLTGCLNHENGLCKGGNFPCYAYKLAHTRLKQRYLANSTVADITNRLRDPNSPLWDKVASDPFYPRFWEEKLYHPWSGKPRGILVCDMSDLFGIGIPEEWTKTVLDLARLHTENRYYLLTKQPQNLPRWSPFPENCWVGVTATNGEMFQRAGIYLEQIEAKVKFLSLEPLLEPMLLYFGKPTIDWLILGACAGSASGIGKVQRKYPELSHKPYKNQWTAQHPIAWLQKIVAAADKAGIRVFEKDNLRPLLGDNLRQEMPDGGQQ